jgi:hypothetical protein
VPIGPDGGVSRDLLGYLCKRLAAGGTVEVDRPPTDEGQGLEGKHIPITGPQFLLGGSITRSDDLCLIAVQGVAMSDELVSLGATGQQLMAHFPGSNTQRQRLPPGRAEAQGRISGQIAIAGYDLATYRSQTEPNLVCKTQFGWLLSGNAAES